MAELAVPDDPSAEFYNLLNPWTEGDDFYLDLVMSAGSVLDSAPATLIVDNFWAPKSVR